MIENSLTKLLDKKLSSSEEVDQFIDGLEEEVFGIPNRDFYLKYKGDIKELIANTKSTADELGFEAELLSALLIYSRQRLESDT